MTQIFFSQYILRHSVTSYYAHSFEVSTSKNLASNTLCEKKFSDLEKKEFGEKNSVQKETLQFVKKNHQYTELITCL